MKNILKRIGLLTLAMFMLSSCSAKSEIGGTASNYDSVNKMLKGLKSYACSAEITYVANKEEVTYKILQYSTLDGRYRLEVIEPENVKGNIFMFDGKTVYQKSNDSDNITMSTVDDAERSQTFLTMFLKNYAFSDTVSVSVGDFDNSSTTMLEANIVGEHSYMATEKMWVDNETLLPKKLVIYDYNNIERIIVVYDQFVPNPQLSDDIFTMIN